MSSDARNLVSVVSQDNQLGFVLRQEVLDESSQSLLEALLLSGIQAYRQYSSSSNPDDRVYHRESYNWIRSDREDSPFSFVCVCEALGLCPKYLREGILGRETRRRIRRDSL